MCNDLWIATVMGGSVRSVLKADSEVLEWFSSGRLLPNDEFKSEGEEAGT